LGAEYAAQNGPFVLNCAYCMWSSKEIGIQFEKPNGIFAQLAKIRNGGQPILTAKDRRKDREERKRDFSGTVAEESQDNEGVEILDPNEKLNAESQFSNLKAFYQTQMTESSPVSALGFTGDYGYGSPGALSRIMGLYTGGSFADTKSKTKTGTMREACDALEGLQITTLSEEEAITKLRNEGWQSTATSEQRKEQTTHTHFLSDLRPIAYLLRTKRSKRCRTCRHILSKPESKVQTTRFRIRLVALNYIPSITIKPLQPALPTSSSLLAPLKPVQFLLTFKNPLFDSVKVTLATPAKTPGRFPTKVTVLCPQFEVGANTDVWDEALRDNNTRSSLSGEKRRTKAEASEGQHQAEAGKVWERGRNWVSVVVEVVPPSLRIEGSEWLRSEELKADGSEIRDGEEVVEIPVFVRVEWEGEIGGEEGGGLGGGGKEKRELAYWCVLGLGKVAVE
jgi:dynactin-4